MDIAKVKDSNSWLKRFLEHNENNIQEIIKYVMGNLYLEKQIGTNEITEANVRKDYIESGLCFNYGKDKDGKTMLVIKM